MDFEGDLPHREATVERPAEKEQGIIKAQADQDQDHQKTDFGDVLVLRKEPEERQSAAGGQEELEEAAAGEQEAVRVAGCGQEPGGPKQQADRTSVPLQQRPDAQVISQQMHK